MEKIKNIATISVFAVIIFSLCIAFFATPGNHRSRTERRLLARPPVLNAQRVLSGEYMTDFETYMQDQFPLREPFRTINALTRRYALRHLDYNGYYYTGGHLSQMEFPLNPQAVESNVAWMNLINQRLFPQANVFYSVIPDKNFFLAPRYGFLSLDYDEMMSIVHRTLRHHTYISLFEALSLADFYRTDIHWRQEAILPVAQHLAYGMGVTLPPADFEHHTLSPFYGNFHGHAALPVPPDELIYLTNRYTESAVVRTLTEENRELVFTNYIDFEGERHPLKVYNPVLFGGMDGYDVFLAGAQALMTIEVPNARTDRELIIFRDSFGSSIAPLLLGGYSKITLVDIRYIPSRILPNFIDLESENTDILFLFSAPLLNRPDLLR